MTDGEQAASRMRPLVLCTVGTDHHPFDRLVAWCDTFAASASDVRVLVQHGSSPPPRVAEGKAFFTGDELAALVRIAHVVITHGGPGSISLARRLGTKPITVPRDPTFGEHVDAHQMRFVARLARSDLVAAVHTETGLHQAIRAQLENSRGSGVDAEQDEARVRAAALRFGDLVERLLNQQRS